MRQFLDIVSPRSNSITEGREVVCRMTPPNISETPSRGILEAAGRTLGDLCTIKTNFEDADFWLVRRGNADAVGQPTRKYDPENIGIKVVATDVLLPNYLYYALEHLYRRGVFAQEAKGVLKLTHLRTEFVRSIPIG